MDDFTFMSAKCVGVRIKFLRLPQTSKTLDQNKALPSVFSVVDIIYVCNWILHLAITYCSKITDLTQFQAMPGNGQATNTRVYQHSIKCDYLSIKYE